ncbi:MAG: 50S ribosomal protein L20 [Parcubacteria group bacterium CG_4_9_14_0_2_um_filter_41_8]|nr:MAG: 50S ribosomal protein L20 [Parcubacteria group bacterium CG1_02_41_12]PIP67242.1 MAG: 50S ribosomal protein L20 [Parcubacteria group bacterium CG22_combo_CG10-13_8_21_14_all_41_9]PIQ80180.1 MAG: 50S ribosomal protein L20 [Parcubacteria group bacterium CG11_big_fil_rev_8_21_14_0_20_41_14]PIR56813.1 MAG: 50S ribosomal protein L20 [Parcubacteria group bacterium CG10_big_fil_rev_8_21_14_0_10_41_35]PIZ80345.1 MAG: 50S ribosomal protein L20 [Parcubacteria group bacterium CG_4_10_14_0_2_um_fil
MPRVKRGTTHVKNRSNILRKAKGFKWGRKKLIKIAKTAVTKAGAHAYRDRRVKKRTTRALWQVKINAAARENKTSYSRLIDGLKKAKIEIDRKVLADIAENDPKVFSKIVKQALNTGA